MSSTKRIFLIFFPNLHVYDDKKHPNALTIFIILAQKLQQRIQSDYWTLNSNTSSTKKMLHMLYICVYVRVHYNCFSMVFTFNMSFEKYIFSRGNINYLQIIISFFSLISNDVFFLNRTVLKLKSILHFTYGQYSCQD